MKKIWALRWWAASLAFSATFAFFYPLAFLTDLTSAILIIVISTLLLVFVPLLISEWLASAYYKRYRYWILSDRIVVRRGVFNIRTATVPFDRIQNVNVRQQILERIYHVGIVEIQTAGSNGLVAEARIEGVKNAKNLASMIFDRVQAVKQSAKATRTLSRPRQQPQPRSAQWSQEAVEVVATPVHVTSGPSADDVDRATLDVLLRITRQLRDITDRFETG